ncbi:MAG: hypothetical protein ACRCYP_03955 [Alphaproteobacteria bacterium]
MSVVKVGCPLPPQNALDMLGAVLENSCYIVDVLSKDATKFVGKWVLVSDNYHKNLRLCYVEKIDGRGILTTSECRFSTNFYTVVSTQKNSSGVRVLMHDLDKSYLKAVNAIQENQKRSRESLKRELQLEISNIDPHSEEKLIIDLSATIKTFRERQQQGQRTPNE